MSAASPTCRQNPIFFRPGFMLSLFHKMKVHTQKYYLMREGQDDNKGCFGIFPSLGGGPTDFLSRGDPRQMLKSRKTEVASNHQ